MVSPANLPGSTFPRLRSFVQGGGGSMPVGEDVSGVRAPFPWYGGKSNAASLVWRAFGNVPNYVEPFAGSIAVLLARPHAAKVETVNDKDGLIANFWRAVQHAPDDVARHCDWPVNEADLHARHRLLGRSTLGVDTAHGMTPCGVLLDPPYAHELRNKQIYGHDDDISGDVRAWALEHGDNPALRIALCGFEGEHEMPASWTKVAWASSSSAKSRAQERIWFSPHCLTAIAQQELFTSPANLPGSHRAALTEVG